MEAEKAKLGTSVEGQAVLEKARKDGADGQYDLAMDQLDEALGILPSNVSASDIYKTKQQITGIEWVKQCLRAK